LAQRISEYLNLPLGELSIRNFADGELWIKYEENIRGCDVFIVQPTNSPAENILELILLVDAAVRASADRVTVVVPYFGYARQDRKDKPRVPISSRVMVDMLTATGANRLLGMDLHSTQIQGFASMIICTAGWCCWTKSKVLVWLLKKRLCYRRIWVR